MNKIPSEKMDDVQKGLSKESRRLELMVKISFDAIKKLFKRSKLCK